MPKQLGLDELAETEETLEDLESPDAEEGEEEQSTTEEDSSEQEEDNTVARLMELGVSRSRAESMSPETRAEAIPIIADRQKQFTSYTEQLKAKADQYEVLRNSQEFQEFLRKREAAKRGEKSADDGPPENATELEVFNWHVQQAVSEDRKQAQQKISELESLVRDLLGKDVRREIDGYRNQFEDWAEYEPQIKAVMQKYPNMELVDAYNLARSQDRDEKLMEQLEARTKKRQKANTLKGGKKGTVPKTLEGVDIRKMSEEEYFDKTAEIILERFERGEIV